MRLKEEVRAERDSCVRKLMLAKAQGDQLQIQLQEYWLLAYNSVLGDFTELAVLRLYREGIIAMSSGQEPTTKQLAAQMIYDWVLGRDM